jgi:hypothetical protein
VIERTREARPVVIKLRETIVVLHILQILQSVYMEKYDSQKLSIKITELHIKIGSG